MIEIKDLEDIFDKIINESEGEKRFKILQAKQKLIEAEVLREMAKPLKYNEGFGFQIELWSNDHEPAHAHIQNSNGDDISRILITDDIPRSIDSIIDLDKNLSRDLKKNLVKWAILKRDDHVYNWTRMKSLWKDIHN